MQLTGKIKTINATQQVSERFSKRTVVIETDYTTQYPQPIEIQFSQDRTDLIEPYNVGQEVVCDINLRGRQWTDNQGEVKTFNTLECWKIQPLNK